MTVSVERDFEFALILSGISELTEEIENAILAGGCDDATLSMQYGTVRLEFLRSATSYQNAVISAIKDVCVAGSQFGVGVQGVDACDLVTASEIAHRSKRTRQCINQYINGSRGPGHFPGPAGFLSNTHPIWRWCDVSFWLATHDMLPKDVINEAQVVSIINHTLEHKVLTFRNRHLVADIEQSLKHCTQ